MDESLAWLFQARADRQAAEREYRAAASRGSRVWSHAVAKYQQAVEKAVKAIVVALRDTGHWNGPPIGWVHEVQRHMPALVRRQRVGTPASVKRHLVRLFDPNLRATIQALEALIPQQPRPGASLRRNTEYPFHDGKGRFTYPAVPGEFAPGEVDRFRAVSHRLLASAGWVVAELRRKPS